MRMVRVTLAFFVAVFTVEKSNSDEEIEKWEKH